MKKYAAEFIGSFAIVFFGTGTAILNAGQIGVAIAFGLIVFLLITFLGKWSDAHFNPAVTIAFALVHCFPKKQVIPYIVLQVAGAISGSLILRIIFPYSENLGATIPSGSELQSFFLEIFLTLCLMLVIMKISHGASETGLYAAIAVGSIVLLEALFAGPICGASMNPARSIGPAIVTLKLNVLWIYILAPIMGACLASALWMKIKSVK